ncbi:MAG: enoyl-CoA hydratase/isomerase family protein [Rhizorhabdus sp.]
MNNNDPLQSAPPAEVRVEILDEVGWIALNRPAVSNAARPSMMRQLCDAIDAFVADPTVKALVIRGEGKHFLAGGDFTWLSEIADGAADDAGGEIYRWFQGATRRITACPKPTIAAISGAAFTVGCELALACDVRLVDRSAYFLQNWLDLGLIAPLGGAMWLPNLIGLAKAKEMLLECRRVGAEEAVEIGLANAMYEDPEQLYAQAQVRALAAAARPPAAYARMKQLIVAGAGCSIEDGWRAGVDAQSELLVGAAFRDAVESRRKR